MSAGSAVIDGDAYMLNEATVVPSYSASIFTTKKTLESMLYIGPIDIDHEGT